MGLLGRRWLLVLGLAAILGGRVVLDVLDKKPGGGIIGLVIGWPYLWFKILPSFLFGMVAYAFRDRLPRSRIIIAGLSTLALAACHLNAHLANLVFAPALAYATFYFAFSGSLRLHAAAGWGDFSYGTYLYAFPAQQIIYRLADQEMSFPVYVAMSLVLSLACGVASWHLVERWFLRRGQRMPSSVGSPFGVRKFASD